MNFDGCFFDLDGTLCDTAPDILGCWRKTLERRGLDWGRFEREFRIGPPLEPTVREIFREETRQWCEELIAEFRAIYVSCGFPETRPYPGIPELLARLQAQGAELFVATNKLLQPSREILKRNGWSDLFRKVFAPDLIAGERHSKAELLSLAVREYGLRPSRCVMIGDTAGDVKAGKEAGMETIGVLWGYGGEAELAGADRIWQRGESPGKGLV